MKESDIPRNEQGKIDYYGIWCPHCHHRASKQDKPGLVMLWLLALVLATLCLPLLMILPAILIVIATCVISLFLPKEWKCYQCQHRWRG